MLARLAVAILLALALAGCAPGQTPGPTIRPSGTGGVGSPAVATSPAATPTP